MDVISSREGKEMRLQTKLTEAAWQRIGGDHPVSQTFFFRKNVNFTVKYKDVTELVLFFNVLLERASNKCLRKIFF